MAASDRVSERFVAVVDVSRTLVRRPADGRSAVSRTEPAPSKETSQVKVTVRSGTLDGLREKVQGVLELLDEDDLELESEGQA